jgi:hypothetical protein
MRTRTIVAWAACAAALLWPGSVAATPGGRPTAFDPASASDGCDPKDCSAWSTFPSTGAPNAMIVAELIADDEVRLTVASRITGYDTIKLVGSDDRCAQPHGGAASRIFSYPEWDVASSGYSFHSTVVPLDGDFRDLRSMRLYDPAAGAFFACARAHGSHRLQPADEAHRAEALHARFNGPNARGVVVFIADTRLDEPAVRADHLEAPIVFMDLTPDRDYTVVTSDTRCGSAMTDDQFEFRFHTNANGARFARPILPHGDAVGIRSLRLLRGEGTGGREVACAPARLLDVWEHA